jgi:Ca-activated chloride channel family protein
LSPDDLVLTDDGVTRQIVSIIGGDEVPLTVGLVLDTSSSMEEPMLQVQESAVRFLETTLKNGDRAFVVASGDTARVVQQPTNDLRALEASILALRAKGMTPLHDAIIVGLLQFDRSRTRRALIVLTDGVDNASRYSAADVVEVARRSGVPHFFARFPPIISGGAPALPEPGHIAEARPALLPEAYNRSLRELASFVSASGGARFELAALSDQQLTRVYADIRRQLAAQSLIVYNAVATKSGWRNVTIRLRDGAGTVRAPSAVYVTAD